MVTVGHDDFQDVAFEFHTTAMGTYTMPTVFLRGVKI